MLLAALNRSGVEPAVLERKNRAGESAAQLAVRHGHNRCAQLLAAVGAGASAERSSNHADARATPRRPSPALHAMTVSAALLGNTAAGSVAAPATGTDTHFMAQEDDGAALKAEVKQEKAKAKTGSAPKKNCAGSG